jgi:hypothetical protein
MIERMFGRDVDDNVDWVPENLEQIPPGYVLAAMLDDIDIERCSGHDRVRVLQAHERMRAHYAARSYHTMAAVVDALKDEYDDEEGLVDEAAIAGAAEIAAVLRLTRRASESQMSLALELQRRLPQVWEALCDGVIDVRRARILVDSTLHLSVATARHIVDKIISDTPLLTTGQLRVKVRKLCIEADPDDATDRYRHAVEDRRVVIEATIDGTADLHALNLPPDRVTAARQHINQLALKANHDGDTRNIDQLRADIVLDLLDGSTTPGHNCRGSVELTIDLPTLLRLAETPGDLAGYGPVIADIARQVTQRQLRSPWQWTINDPDTGMPIATGTTRRRPTASQRRLVQTLHRSCVHPGCRMPATNCDIDHRVPWAQCHTTNTNNLAPLYRYHHILKHKHGWTHQPLPGGDYQFTSALGHQYTTSGRSP